MASRPYNAREITIQLERALVDDFGETAFAILRNLVAGSPVGRPLIWQRPESAPEGYVGGHFRRNWVVSIGGFNTQEIEGVDPTGAPTIAAGKNQIDGFRRGQGRTATGQFTGRATSLVIQNNVPYANRLAEGHSSQALAGWVDEQIDAALTIPGGTKVLT